MRRKASERSSASAPRAGAASSVVQKPCSKGNWQVRGLYASASRFLEERKYDGALADFERAADAAPEFAPTAWRLALMYEAMGNVDRARKSFTLYRQLETNPAGQQEADLHLDTLDAKRGKYDEEIDHATETLSDLFNRAMNLTFNGLEDRASQYKQRAREREPGYTPSRSSKWWAALPFRLPTRNSNWRKPASTWRARCCSFLWAPKPTS
jgi:tetratricopeptide (TPR) repeat protein